MSYIILRGRWFHIIVLNVHAPKEHKTNMKNSFYEEFEHVFNKFPKCHTEILAGDFNAKEGIEDIFKLTIGNESLHKISNDNGVRAVHFATSKNLTVKSTCSHIATFINILGCLQMGNPTIRLTIF
jgi:hypothetical protein